MPFATSVAENKKLKNLASPVVSRLARIRSGGEEDATHFGPRSHVRAWAACGMARSSVRRRFTVAAIRVAAKPAGNLRRVIASISNHVGGAAAGKIADYEFRGDRNPRLRELVRSSCGGDLLTLDEYTVAIKDDHGSLAPARSLRGRAARMLFHESPLNNKNRGRGKSRAPCGSGIFLHNFLLRTPTVAEKRP